MPGTASPLFGSSGIRRSYSSDMPRFAIRLGAALASLGGPVLLGNDTRTTSPLLSGCIIAGAVAAGVEIGLAGTVPTPALAFGIRRGAAAGCMVTASHNPEYDNGFKIFNPDGSSLMGASQNAFEGAIAESHIAPWDGQGHTRRSDPLPGYTDAIIAAHGGGEGILVVLDCANGAASAVSPEVLSAAGHTVRCINCDPSGHFARPSEPLPENLPYLPEFIRREGCAAGVAHDGDADRMVAFDSRGRFISGDRLLVLFAQFLGASRVVTTTDASMVIEEVAEVRRTPVGDAFVAAALSGWGDLGGEPSGAWIFPGHSLCPDGPYAAALFCEIVAEWDIEEALLQIPEYPILRESVPHPDPRGVLTLLGAESPTDGVRFEDEQGWCLIRASGTEPKIRVTAEGRSAHNARELLKRGMEKLRSAKDA
ncbi:MAG: phosphopentomutase/phosphoglucosamine mutase [Methanomicrobiales archaeon]|nr:phosphopentomutase/phosphoglucosamine mutase [Methanomicrobiales archaeon]